MSSDFTDFLAQRISKDEPKLKALDVQAVILRDALKAYNHSHDLKPGMLVRQKPGCRRYRVPAPDQLAIVVRRLDSPIMEPDPESGGEEYRQLMDIVIGVWYDGDGTFCMYHVDSQRFEPVPEAEL